MEWIKINREKDDIPEPPFFLMNQHGYAWVGFNAFDYYDEAIYWFPFPKVPVEFSDTIITNDLCIRSLLNKG